ncbi:MAG TPA: hypothetical protein VIL65_12810 [Beijerinckiaceae bacterium]|jgi:hypothetical protein
MTNNRHFWDVEDDRDLLIERLELTALYAAHAAQYVAVGDRLGATFALGRLAAYQRAACAEFTSVFPCEPEAANDR